MSEEQSKRLQSAIEKHGLDYAMRYLESWRDIEDNEFQNLLTKYREASNFIEGYIKDAEAYAFVKQLNQINKP